MGQHLALLGLLGTTLAAGPLQPASAQSLPLDSLFRAHRLPMSFADDAPSGAGWNFIVEQASAMRFVMIGESHYVREIPLFTSRLFRTLHDRAGFQYLAVEDGPWAIGMLMEPGVRGERAATYTRAVRYLNALQFLNDQDIDLIVDAGRISSGRSDPVWGLDQTWGVLHILDRLQALAASPAKAVIVEKIAARARPLEAHRPDENNPRFITHGLTQDDLGHLRAAMADAPPEAARLLEMLETSFELYAARTDAPAIYRANDRRERYMKARFAQDYDAARAAGDPAPRVLLKFGHWHAIRGVLNWGDIQPLGTFVSELAHREGGESLHLWTGLVDEPGRYWTLFDSPDYVPLAKAGSTDGWWVIDLREIRPLVAAGMVDGVNSEMRRIIFGFDLALLIGNGDRATYDQLRMTAEREQ